MPHEGSRTPRVPDRVREWNATAADYPRDALLSHIFAETVRRSPDAPAVVRGQDTWSYGELYCRVRGTAAHLRSRGVRDGDIVGVLLDRSLDAVVAAMGILEAGGVYLPLDPTHPETRSAAVFADSGCGHVVTTREVKLPEGTRCVRVLTDELARHPLPSPDTRWASRRRVTDPAYIVYTSGSTGTPKGVVCAHRGLARLLAAGNPSIPGPHDRLLATAGLTFDVSCYEIFCTLLNGACLVLVDAGDLLDSAALDRAMTRHGVTHLWLSAGLFHQHATAAPQIFASLRCLMAGADVLDPSAVRNVLEHGRPHILLNGYGPSENTIMSTTYRVDAVPPEARSIPIGRPVANTTAYVVDDDGNLAAVGTEGELWVGGDGVALGYLDDPDRTAARFVADRFGENPSGRLYRTGDLVRWRDDGVLEFLGRRDRQVKVRGFRVELGEVEAVLRSHPEVREAAVDTAGTGAGEHLVAVVVCATDTDASDLTHRLGNHARDRLPTYMVPARVLLTRELSLTDSGKVDRGRLLALLDHAEPAKGATHAAPRDPAEEAVARIWSETLGVEDVAPDDDFFALGGTSLHAIHVVAAVRAHPTLGAHRDRAAIRALLDNPTLARFTAYVRSDADIRGAQRADGDGDGDVRPDDALDERWLDPGLRFTAPPASVVSRPGNVLLTGGTGFLGVHLIDRLARAGACRLYCLVRAHDENEGFARLVARMRKYRIDPSRYRDRLVAVPGQLALPHLGLDQRTWDRLAHEIDVVVHSGSHVNFAYPYDALAPANVRGTASIVELAAAHRLKAVHHISTIGVLAGFAAAGVRRVSEDTPLAHAERISTGYVQTKYVAEHLVATAAERGLPLTIHRPSEISGTTDRGVWNTDTMMCALIRTIAETGLAPDHRSPLDLVPVDHAADVITRTVTHAEADGSVFHIANPRPAEPALLVERLRTMGYHIRTLPSQAWIDTIARHVADDRRHPMAPYLPLLLDPPNTPGVSVKDMYFGAALPDFDRHNTDRVIAEGNLTCPSVDGHMIDLYLRHFRRVGFLPPPPTHTDVH